MWRVPSDIICGKGCSRVVWAVGAPQSSVLSAQWGTIVRATTDLGDGYLTLDTRTEHVYTTVIRHDLQGVQSTDNSINQHIQQACVKPRTCTCVHYRPPPHSSSPSSSSSSVSSAASSAASCASSSSPASYSSTVARGTPPLMPSHQADRRTRSAQDSGRSQRNVDRAGREPANGACDQHH